MSRRRSRRSCRCPFGSIESSAHAIRRWPTLSAEIDAGVMLPCNVIVYEGDDGRTVVNIVDPLQTMARESTPLREIAEQAREKLARVLERLA